MFVPVLCSVLLRLDVSKCVPVKNGNAVKKNTFNVFERVRDPSRFLSGGGATSKRLCATEHPAPPTYCPASGCDASLNQWCEQRCPAMVDTATGCAVPLVARLMAREMHYGHDSSTKCLNYPCWACYPVTAIGKDNEPNLQELFDGSVSRVPSLTGQGFLPVCGLYSLMVSKKVGPEESQLLGDVHSACARPGSGSSTRRVNSAPSCEGSGPLVEGNSSGPIAMPWRVKLNASLATHSQPDFDWNRYSIPSKYRSQEAAAPGATLATTGAISKTTRLRWLLAIAMPCAGHDGGVSLMCTESDIRNHAAPSFHIWVNIFDNASCLSTTALSSPYVHTSRLPGYMTLFWKHVLTRSVTRQYDIIALKDADLYLSPHTFSLSEAEYWLHRTQASIITPAIAAPAGARAGRTSISLRAYVPECIAVRSSVAEQLKIARTEAFETSLKGAILDRLDDAILATDSYMMQLWVVLSEMHFPHRPGCVHLRHVVATHLDTRTIRGAMAKAYFTQNRIVGELFKLYPDAFVKYRLKNFTHGCWSLFHGEDAQPTSITPDVAANTPGPLGNPKAEGWL